MRRNRNDGRRPGRIQREGVRTVPRQRDHAQRVRDLRVRPLHQEQVSGETGPSCQAPLQGQSANRIILFRKNARKRRH